MAKSPIQLVRIDAALSGFAIVRPGARWAVQRSGEEHRGRWLNDGERLSGAVDVFLEAEARLLLPLLRDMDGMAAGKGGRPAADPTSPDGRLIARACKRLGLTAAALAKAIGAHESVLSRARHGTLRETHRRSIQTLLKAGVTEAAQASP